ncbi:MAG: J domain-containing protein [Vicinamibacterales bacterium]
MQHHDEVERAYAILELPRGSSEGRVRARYLELAKTWHPDRWASNPANEAAAAQRMRDINWALQVVEGQRPVATATSRPGHQESPLSGRPPFRDPPPIEPRFGRDLTAAEKQAIAEAIGPKRSWSLDFGFLWWLWPLLLAGSLLQGHGASLAHGARELPPTTTDRIAAGGLVALSVGVFVYRRRLKRKADAA